MVSPVAEIWPTHRDISLNGQSNSGETRARQRDLSTRNQIRDDEDENVVPVPRTQFWEREARDTEKDVQEVEHGQGHQQNVEGTECLLTC